MSKILKPIAIVVLFLLTLALITLSIIQSLSTHNYTYLFFMLLILPTTFLTNMLADSELHGYSKQCIKVSAVNALKQLGCLIEGAIYGLLLSLPFILVVEYHFSKLWLSLYVLYAVSFVIYITRKYHGRT